MKKTLIYLLLILIPCLVISCSGSDSRQEKGKLIKKEDFGDAWPFKVDEGRLECINSAVIFHTEGKTYAVNGMASGQGKYRDIEEIWLYDPSFPDSGIRINIGSIIDAGLELCK